MGLDHRNTTGLGETETQLLEGTHCPVCTGILGKSKYFTGACARPTCSSCTVSSGGRVWLWLTVETRTLAELSEGTHCYELSWSLILIPRSGPTQQLVGVSAGTPHARQSTGQEHSTIHQQRGSLKSSWIYNHIKHIPWHNYYPQRDKKISTHQKTGRNPSYQENCSSL